MKDKGDAGGISIWLGGIETEERGAHLNLLTIEQRSPTSASAHRGILIHHVLHLGNRHAKKFGGKGPRGKPG